MFLLFVLLNFCIKLVTVTIILYIILILLLGGPEMTKYLETRIIINIKHIIVTDLTVITYIHKFLYCISRTLPLRATFSYKNQSECVT